MDMVFSTVLKGSDADPRAEILRKRVTALRRILAKHPEEEERVTQLVWMHITARREGTYCGDEDRNNATPAPLPAPQDAQPTDRHSTKLDRLVSSWTASTRRA